MPRRSLLPLAISLPRESSNSAPLHRLIYSAIREAILSGQWREGTRLPSSRELASELAVSRTTIVAAFDQLLAEGYVEGVAGSGTFIARVLPDDFVRSQQNNEDATRQRLVEGPKLSRRGYLIDGLQPFSGMPAEAFAPGRPDVSLFPFDLWARLHARIWRSPSVETLNATDPLGYRPLREALAKYLIEVRALRCDPSQVLIVSGAQQAYDLIGRVLLDPGDEVWYEEPGFPPGKAAYAAAGARIVPVSVDDNGLVVDEGRALSAKARLASVTPSHQYPLGSVMSLGRRRELLGWAADANAWIVEDDYDGEFRYDGRPMASLQGLDRERRVIYIGSFSKVLLPSIRLGFVVVPEHVVAAFGRARALVDQYPAMWQQPTMEMFISENYLASHIRRVRRIYKNRRDKFLQQRPYLDGLLDIEPNDTGIHLVARLSHELSKVRKDTEIVNGLRLAGLHATALSTLYFGPNVKQGLLLGYACVSEAAMETRVRQLASALRAMMHEQ